ncbi:MULTISPECIES: cytochrome-c peroxidase [unclassified Nostoc]|uniref:cytochrome-c peroxidase n=1 Tax=unclassified Nostoc TaxID=2593658 RepID=UPI001F558284|nr:MULTISPECIES: cytochrome c peroxidase [unclassified Nostoc]
MQKRQILNHLQSKRLGAKFSKPIVIAAIVSIAIIAGNTVSAQVTTRPLTSLKTVKVPEPDNLTEFVKNKVAAIKLGKALFWDMQIGSDGVTACASCHFHAGADNRSKNQVSPGLLRVNADKTVNPDTVFDVGGAPNYQLKTEDFPLQTNDVVSSQGAFKTEFVDVKPGNDTDQVKDLPDPVFNVNNINVRRVQPRNTPTVIGAVFNFRNFWDGRAQEIFNGVNEFGLRDPNATVVKAITPNRLESLKVSLNHASLASQAVGPPLSSSEMSADGRTFAEIGDKFGAANQKSHGLGKGRKILRRLGKKLIGKGKALRPLGKQIVHPQDSVLGKESRWPLTGMQTSSYEKLIAEAFQPQWWRSNRIIQVNADGSRTFVNKPDNSLQTNDYTLMEYNFPLFFGLAVQMYESTLISDDTPLDRFLEGKANLSDEQKRGKALFENKAQCIGCHNGGELTKATVSAVDKERIGTIQIPNARLVFDEGWVNIGVRPTLEDVGVGGSDPFGNPLSEPRLALLGTFKKLLGSEPNTTVTSSDVILADGSFKIPGLRNIELTAPYFHNGGYLTLEQVVDFYNRGGDFRQQSALRPLNLTEQEQADLVAFMKALTDDRVRDEKAPFDHPQLLVPNGHQGDSTFVTSGGNGKAKDRFLEIPAVGKYGGKGTPNFLANK